MQNNDFIVSEPDDSDTDSSGHEDFRQSDEITSRWHCQLPPAHKLITDSDELFCVFSSLPPTKDAHWDFLRKQLQLRGNSSICSYGWQRKKLIRDLPETVQYGIVQEKEGMQRKFEFRGEKYPQKRFPRRKFRDLYRETITSLKGVLAFWIDLHNPDVREKLIRQKDKGSAIMNLCNELYQTTFSSCRRNQGRFFL